jgi:hypothetical protein
MIAFESIVCVTIIAKQFTSLCAFNDVFLTRFQIELAPTLNSISAMMLSFLPDLNPASQYYRILSQPSSFRVFLANKINEILVKARPVCFSSVVSCDCVDA